MNSMENTIASYRAADSAGRAQLLLELIDKHSYFMKLNQELAKENPALIAQIAEPLRRTYPYFFNHLLCDVVAAQGMNTLVDILQRINFADHINPINLKQIDDCYTQDSNPLHIFYDHCGPKGFIALYEAGVVSLRQLYLWVRADDIAPKTTKSSQFILALAEHYAHDFDKAPPALTECFVAECDIATMKGNIYYLEEHLPLLDQLLSRLGADGFCDFLTYFSAKLHYRPAHEAAENLLYCKFLRYASLTHIPIGDWEALCPQFWTWLIDHASELSDIRDFLFTAIEHHI